jgi:hypothetical protein
MKLFQFLNVVSEFQIQDYELIKRERTQVMRAKPDEL